MGVTHESQIWKRDSLPLLADPAKVTVPPYYPDVPEVRHDIARNLSNIIEMDKQAGKLIQQLKDSGLYDNCIIFFYSDHGDGLPYVKREITKRGLHIPLIIKFAQQVNAGKTDNQLISGIDLGPTVLSLAGVTIPQYMQGKAFLGTQKKAQRKYIFAARDRMDAEVDRVRSIFDGRYQYIRNYMPEKPYYQEIAYRLQIPMMKKILEMKESGKLNDTQMRWFSTKPAEELYDTEKDPYQLNNVAANPSYKNKFQELKLEYEKWINDVGDRNALPERELVKQMWNYKDSAPVTEKPELVKTDSGYLIRCSTQGASIGYKVTGRGDNAKMDSWKVYNSGAIHLNEGDKIIIKAQRIGFGATESVITITN